MLYSGIQCYIIHTVLCSNIQCHTVLYSGMQSIETVTQWWDDIGPESEVLAWCCPNIEPLPVVNGVRRIDNQIVKFLIIFCRLTFKPSRCIKASFYIPENGPNFSKTKGFWAKISKKLVYQYKPIFFTFSPTSHHHDHLHSLQDENCDSNSRLVVDEDDNG